DNPGAGRPRHRRVARRAAGEDAVLERVQGVRPLVGRAAAVLRPRVAAFVALAAVIGLYYAFHESLWNESVWWDIAFMGFLLIPAVFGLVYLALPLWRSPPLRLGLAALAFAALAVVLEVTGAEGAATFAELGATTAVGWLFL